MNLTRVISAICFLFWGLNLNAADTSSATVSVNGTNISTAGVDAQIKTLVANGQKETPELRQQLINQLINTELLAQQARNQGLDKTERAQRGLEIIQRNYLAKLMIEDFAQKNPLTDAEIKNAYDVRVAEINKNHVKEYKLRSILVSSESEANSIIAKLKSNESFEKIAKEKSIGPLKSVGGEMGWVLPANLDQSLANEVLALAKGSNSQKPVKSSAGYRVIKVEDIRQFSLPSYDQYKPLLARELMAKKINDYLNNLNKSAKIQVK
jgi:peptidyl-prolyl cis-trans isomerase C